MSGGEDPTIEFSLAGHHPILHYRRNSGTVEGRSVSNLALAILPDAPFRTGSITCEEGDVLLVVTDGITEAADQSGKELTLDPLKRVLIDASQEPLRTMAVAVRSAALRQGPQIDDQTILLVRRNPVVNS